MRRGNLPGLRCADRRALPAAAMQINKFLKKLTKVYNNYHKFYILKIKTFLREEYFATLPINCGYLYNFCFSHRDQFLPDR